MAMDVISTQESAMILEFLLLQPNIGGNILNPLLTKFIPIHRNDPRIIQTLLLQKLSSDVSSISEKTLDLLERIEDFYYSNGIRVSDSIRQAYCAVAVHCTVLYLKNGGTNCLRDYFEAVVRIWRGRVCDMEKFGNVGLVSIKLREMKCVIEEVTWNENVRNDVLRWDTFGDAVRLVGVFVRDALKEFGDSRLEIALKQMRKVDAAGVENSNSLPGGTRGCNGGHKEVAAEIHGVENAECELDLPHDRIQEAQETNGDGMGVDSVTVVRGGVISDHQLLSPQIERVKEAHNRNSSDVAVGSGTETHREANVECEVSVPEVRRLQEVLTASASDSQPVVEDLQPRAENVESQLSSPPNERAQGEHHTNGNNLAARSVSEILREVNVRLTLPAPEAERHEALGASSSNLQVEIEDPHPSAANDKYEISSPVIKRVQEALRSSTLDLRAVVTDPLPDALRMAAAVSASMAREVTGVQNTVPAGEGVEASGNADQVRNHSAVARPSLMSRNKTARTYEWSEDSNDSSDEGSPNRPRLPTPRTITVSPIVIRKVKHAKRRKKFWSVLEEETLRKAVNEIGRGNWTRILDENRDVFEERTAGDLKDKWRNMTK